MHRGDLTELEGGSSRIGRGDSDGVQSRLLEILEKCETDRRVYEALDRHRRALSVW